MLKLTDYTRISVTSTAESALKKLKKAEIPVFDCKKQGLEFVFAVKDKDVKKVFAIFQKPCYNVRAKALSPRKRVLAALSRRAGLIFGALAAVVAIMIADCHILRVEVGGSGSYLAPEVERIVALEGGRTFGTFSSLNYAKATGRILALPQVTFCHIEKRGSVLHIDVRTENGASVKAEYSPLVSDADGTVKTLAAVCGTAAVEEGQSVKRGDVLIYPYIETEKGQIPCFAAGFAEIECKRQAEYFAETDSEESLRQAYASLLLETENVIERSYKVKPTADGVVYVIDFTYLHKVSINLN